MAADVLCGPDGDKLNQATTNSNLLALAMSFFGKFFSFDRERSFCPVMTIVNASTYQMFAAIGDTN